MKKLALAVSLALAGTSPVMAEGWAGDAELGFSATTGNTEDTTLNAKLDMDYASGTWRHNIFGDVYYAETGSTKTAERFALGYKPSYFFTEKDYIFGLLRYDQDQFSDIDSRTTEVIGYGRQLINTQKTYLEAEIGAGARQTDYIVNPAGLQSDEAIVYLGGRFSTRLSDSARFIQNLRVEIGDDNTFAESITGLQMRVTDAISAKLTYTVRHNTDVVGVLGEKTDSITGVNLVYSF